MKNCSFYLTQSRSSQRKSEHLDSAAFNQTLTTQKHETQFPIQLNLPKQKSKPVQTVIEAWTKASKPRRS
jgi:hypothetical protein